MTLLYVVIVPTCAYGATSSNKAYNRSVKAVLDYQDKNDYWFSTVEGDHKDQCSVIKVDVSDLKIKAADARIIMDRVHFDSEYWWVNLIGSNKFTEDSKTGYVSSLNYPCIYTDSQITAMRKDFEQAVKLALRSVKKCKTGVQKIHAIHDWMCTSCKFFYNGDIRYKMAYSCLVQGIGDCSSFALATNLLLKRSGFKTAFAENMDVDHVWNMVMLKGKWYHVDTKWDQAWSYNKNKKLYWPHSICHRWLLQSDSVLKYDDHEGWATIYNGEYKKVAASSDKYRLSHFETWCTKVSKGSLFRNGMYSYKIVGKKKVRLLKTFSRLDLAYTVPAKVVYRDVTYKVVGIAPKAFKNCTSEKLLKISSKSLAKKLCKNCLKSSSFTYVKVSKSNYKSYKKIFLKPQVCGASIKAENYLIL